MTWCAEGPTCSPSTPSSPSSPPSPCDKQPASVITGHMTSPPPHYSSPNIFWRVTHPVATESSVSLQTHIQVRHHHQQCLPICIINERWPSRTFIPRSPEQPWTPWGPLGPGGPRSPCNKHSQSIQKWNQNTRLPPVAGCSTAHKLLPLRFRGWDKLSHIKQMFLSF